MRKQGLEMELNILDLKKLLSQAQDSKHQQITTLHRTPDQLTVDTLHSSTHVLSVRT